MVKSRGGMVAGITRRATVGDGWWWDVGGFWYFYPEQIEGPPDYVSDVEVADEATDASSPAVPAPPEEPNYAIKRIARRRGRAIILGRKPRLRQPPAIPMLLLSTAY
jgi:hypothetical protein